MGSKVSSIKSSSLDEYKAIFEVASQLLVSKANRASLLLYVGCEKTHMDSYAAFVGMLPFRGIQVALISRRNTYGELLNYSTPSQTFNIDGLLPARMGKFNVHIVFGHLNSILVSDYVRVWDPIDITHEKKEKDVTNIPFKVGGLELPMLTHNGSFHHALRTLARLLIRKYPNGYTPIVSCGETCDALGYAQDMLDFVGQPDGYLFNHKSGETHKNYHNYGSDNLFAMINSSKKGGSTPVIIAVGGGVNGNCIGLIAAMTGVDLIEVPTTPMHYNDAVTSAKKAMSLVINNRIVSKNILGAFYLPKLAFCVNEWLLTISSASAHATVGEASKTMNMLGIANSSVGASDFHNVLGAYEFASDYSKIVLEIEGFENFIKFIELDSTAKMKARIVSIGLKIAKYRNSLRVNRIMNVNNLNMCSLVTECTPNMTFPPFISKPCRSNSRPNQFNTKHLPNLHDFTNENLQNLMETRSKLMNNYRTLFYNLPATIKNSIFSFFTTINKEIVSAKAMFLSYSDPFEKYRALLFEYAHTLAHGVEAFTNDLYFDARKYGIYIPSCAVRLHGQFVGMAVLWAGEMSKNLNKLGGTGYILHQSFTYLFNRYGGFSFSPLRKLCNKLGVNKEEFCDRVLQIVRRDNKRGYCDICSSNQSVDQLVTCRPGRMLRSADTNAEIRYLVQVNEVWQREVLIKAFEGYFDNVADFRDQSIVFVPLSEVRNIYSLYTTGRTLSTYIRKELFLLYDNCNFL